MKLFFNSDIPFPMSAYFNLSHERDLIWLANNDLPEMAGISRDRSNHATKQQAHVILNKRKLLYIETSVSEVQNIE